MESGVGAGASGHGMRPVGGCWGAREGLRRDVAAVDGGESPSRGASVRNGTAFPAPLAADMRTGPLAARRLSMWNGYGAAQHVRRKKEDG